MIIDYLTCCSTHSDYATTIRVAVAHATFHYSCLRCKCLLNILYIGRECQDYWFMAMIFSIFLFVIFVMSRIRSPLIESILWSRQSNQSSWSLPCLGPSHCITYTFVIFVISVLAIQLSSSTPWILQLQSQMLLL